MAISTQRFKFLDEETNLSISDLYTSGNTDILNSPMNDLKDIDSNMEEFLQNAMQSVKSKLPLDEVPGNFRLSKDGLPDLTDISNLSQNDLISLALSMMPDNPLAQGLFSQMSNKCRGRAGGRRGSGRPYGQQNSCNGNQRQASQRCGSNGSSQFGSALSKYTNGAFQYDFLDLDGQLTSITSLSSMGYNMNMCGVFGSLSQNVPYQDMLSKASGSLMGSLSSSNNILGMMDLANSSANLKTKLFNPSTITSMLSSFVFPSEIKQRDNSSLANRYTGAMELFDSNWNRSRYDQTLTTHGISNRNMNSLMHQRALDNIYDENHLDIAPSDDASFMSLSF